MFNIWSWSLWISEIVTFPTSKIYMIIEARVLGAAKRKGVHCVITSTTFENVRIGMNEVLTECLKPKPLTICPKFANCVGPLPLCCYSLISIFRKFRLIAENVQGREVLTNFHGMSLTTDKLKSMVKKWQVKF